MLKMPQKKMLRPEVKIRKEILEEIIGETVKNWPETLGVASELQSKKTNVETRRGASWTKNLLKYFAECCCKSTIHGVRYLGESGRLVIEKLFWSVIIVIMCCFCVDMILHAYDKWKTTPVIVTFAATETPIWKIPFPAVTVCPEVKYNPEIFNYTDVFIRKLFERNVTAQEERYFQALSLICSGHAELFESNLTVAERALQDLVDVFHGIDSTNITSLFWLGRKHQLKDMLSRSFTSEGICYSFNMFHHDDIMTYPGQYALLQTIKGSKSRKWSLEWGYPDGEELDTFPRRTFASGIKGGLMLELYINNSHLDYLCKESIQGFKVTLHHPSELPNMDKHFLVPLDNSVLVAVKPQLISFSEELKSYKLEDRNCYFANEKCLGFFKTYTQQNCLDECLSNFTLVKCGCVAFYMPKYESWPICGPASYDCLEESRTQYLMPRPDLTRNDIGPDCNCLPPCTALEYDVEISQNVWKWSDSYKIFADLRNQGRMEFDYKKSHISRLAVYYREMQFLASQRQELYGYVEFFSHTGGLLGLFIGFSVVSGVEIIYFLTIRIFCNIKRFGQEFWMGKSNPIE